MIISAISFPLTEPVLIIALVLIILLIAPVLFERIHIPAIAGLLLSGAIIGPHGLNLVSPDLEFTLLGTMGLLYLMFLAGLEIDMIDFIENKSKSIFIGIASFLLPFALGYLVSRYVLHYEIVASGLIASMLSAHTLISYPLMGRLGIVNKPIVTIIVGATIITDILALVSMEVITSFAEGGSEIDNLILLLLRFILFLFIMLVIIPKLSQLFLNKYEGELGVQYIFVLVILFSSAAIARLLSIEPIIGAFFSGLMLNRHIMKTSPLFIRIEFIGNNFFIPFFLISMGILANFKVYLHQPFEMGILSILIITAISGKYLAAFISKLVFKTTRAETNLVFGLSVSRAASAIAIVLIGYHMDILSESILNATLILILVTSIVSSYVSRKAGGNLLKDQGESILLKRNINQKILVSVANPVSMENLLEFSILLKDDKNGLPIYPTTIFTKRDQIRKKIDENQQTVQNAIKSLHTEIPFEPSSRIDSNITNGIVRAAEEIGATMIIVGWSDHSTPLSSIFGNVRNNLLNKTEKMLVVLKTPSSFSKVRKIHLFCSENAEYEIGFALWMQTVVIMATKMQHQITVHCKSEITLAAIREFTKEEKTVKYFLYKEDQEEGITESELKNSTSDLLLFIHSREKTISYDRSFENFMNSTVSEFMNNNIILIYPEL